MLFGASETLKRNENKKKKTFSVRSFDLGDIFEGAKKCNQGKRKNLICALFWDNEEGK